jgi:hypothetical protein
MAPINSKILDVSFSCSGILSIISKK